jgi:hypothetical protein
VFLRGKNGNLGGGKELRGVGKEIFLQHGVAGYGGVLRDHFGFWIKGFARNIGTKLLLLMLGYGGLTMVYALSVEVVSPI